MKKKVPKFYENDVKDIDVWSIVDLQTNKERIKGYLIKKYPNFDVSKIKNQIYYGKINYYIETNLDKFPYKGLYELFERKKIKVNGRD